MQITIAGLVVRLELSAKLKLIVLEINLEVQANYKAYSTFSLINLSDFCVCVLTYNALKLFVFHLFLFPYSVFGRTNQIILCPYYLSCFYG